MFVECTTHEHTESRLLSLVLTKQCTVYVKPDCDPSQTPLPDSATQSVASPTTLFG